MATASRHRKAKDFNIHEDDPYTEDAGMNTEVEDEEGHADHDHDGPLDEDQEPEQDAEEEDEGEGDGDGDGSMSDEEMRDDEIRDDEMTKLQDAFPGFKHKYRLIKRIGEGEAAPELPRSRIHARTNIVPAQAHSRPSTKPKTCSTNSMTTSGIWKRKMKSGRCHPRGPRRPRGSWRRSVARSPPSWKQPPDHNGARNMSPSRRSTSLPPLSASSTSWSYFTTFAIVLPSAPWSQPSVALTKSSPSFPISDTKTSATTSAT